MTVFLHSWKLLVNYISRFLQATKHILIFRYLAKISGKKGHKLLQLINQFMYLTWSVHLAKKLVYGYATKKKKKGIERLKRRLKTN